MARVVDLTGENVTRQKRKERNFGTKTDLASTVVERGSTHWAEGSNVNIDGFLGVAGTATVSGVLSVTGTFNASGDINLSGSTSVTGPLDITGATTIGGSLDVTGPTTIDGVLTINGDTSITGLLEVTGDTTISGTLDIEGVTTLNNDLNVTNSGEINVGTNMTLTPLADGGSIRYLDNSKLTSTGGVMRMVGAGSGAEVRASLNTAQFQVGSNIMGVDTADWFMGNLAGASMMSAGDNINLTSPLTNVSSRLDVGGQLRVAGSIIIFSNLPETAYPPNLHVTSGGTLYRTTWTP